jgi:hypothetical protein
LQKTAVNKRQVDGQGIHIIFIHKKRLGICAYILDCLELRFSTRISRDIFRDFARNREIKISAIPQKKSKLPQNFERIFARQLAIME